MVPQIIITLSPRGELIAELPGANGMRRPIPITSLESLSRILHAQIGRASVELGTDGAPTQRQVTHWEAHETFPNPQCPFCRAEGRIRGAHKPRAINLGPRCLTFGDSGLEKITHLPKRSRKLARQPQNQTTTAKVSDLF